MKKALAWTAAIASIFGIALSCGARSELDVSIRPEAGGGGHGTGGSGTGGSGGQAPPLNCADAGITFAYVVTDQKDIYAFDPSSNTFNSLGHMPCAPSGAQSMAVDRAGRAYVESNDYHLYLVDLGDVACTETPFSPSELSDFGMAFSSNESGSGETLYLVDTGSELASLDVGTFAIHKIGHFSKDVGECELTGTGDGRLFAFGVVKGGSTHLAEIDTTNAEVLSDTLLPLKSGSGWAFAWWGGAFYFFTSQDNEPSTVSRYDMTSGAVETVATAPGMVVGAGVSTCAPTD